MLVTATRARTQQLVFLLLSYSFVRSFFRATNRMLSFFFCVIKVVAAVSGRCEIYLDGGICRGTDVFKALALGAKAVFIGRPVLWGLAHSVSQVMLYTT